MKFSPLPALTFFALLGACAGDNHVTTESGREPARTVHRTSAGAEASRPNKVAGKYLPERVYLITRLETSDQQRGEWRAQGDTIRERGSEIEFVELGSGKLVSFTAPHQITPMDSRSDRGSVRVLPDGATENESAVRYP